MWGERVELFIWKLNSKPSDVNFSGWPNTDGLKLFGCYFVNSLSPRRGYNWILITAAEIIASHQTLTSSTSSSLANDSEMNWEKGCESFILFWAVIPVSRAIPGQQGTAHRTKGLKRIFLVFVQSWEGSCYSVYVLFFSRVPITSTQERRETMLNIFSAP